MKDLKIFVVGAGSIGKRYRRRDEIGTPYCLTIDYDSLEDQALTIRDRDSMKQERIKISAVEDVLENELGWKNLLLNLA